MDGESFALVTSLHPLQLNFIVLLKTGWGYFALERCGISPNPSCQNTHWRKKWHFIRIPPFLRRSMLFSLMLGSFHMFGIYLNFLKAPSSTKVRTNNLYNWITLNPPDRRRSRSFLWKLLWSPPDLLFCICQGLRGNEWPREAVSGQKLFFLPWS